MSICELRKQFPATIQDRTPNVAYHLERWLKEEPPSFGSDWLIAAFEAAPGPALTGKFKARRIRSA